MMKHNILFFKNLLLVLLLFCEKMSLAQANGDCSTAFVVATQDSLYFPGASDEGKDDKEADLIACFMNKADIGQAEHNSTWLRFEIETAGTLTFAITPDYITDNYDFVLFKLPKNGDCRFKQIVRCMASDGEGDGTSPCAGETGLRDGETDASEDGGCEDEDDNAWLAPLKVGPSERYVLLVSNASTAYQGFTIKFKCSCTFKK